MATGRDERDEKDKREPRAAAAEAVAFAWHGERSSFHRGNYNRWRDGRWSPRNQKLSQLSGFGLPETLFSIFDLPTLWVRESDDLQNWMHDGTMNCDGAPNSDSAR